MLYQLRSYINHYLRSTNRHGIHSPFVYDLVTKCFNDKTKYPEYSVLDNHRNRLQQNIETILVTDFGAGSKVFRSNERKVASIAKHAGITIKRQRLLFRLVQYFKFEDILELGTSLGLGTSALALGNSEAKVVSVEGCPATSQKAQELFDEFRLKNIQLNNSTFEDFLSSNSQPDTGEDEGKNDHETYDLVYIDGNHSKERTVQYFEILLKKAGNDSVFIFDDIYWSEEMTGAWRQISAHPKVTVSIDTFQWGLVFFRKEQEKEHFRIRV